MLSKLQSLFKQLSESSDPTISLTASEQQLAAAALLVEVATIDQQFDNLEMTALKQQLVEQFALSSEEIETLITKATDASKTSSSLYEFTQLINRHCNDNDKYQLICGLWRIAYADGNLDKYEEHIIRRVADLIHVRHSEFIRAKHAVRNT
jgi:uncharacterized tellurite resistance protein B-like protein